MPSTAHEAPDQMRRLAEMIVAETINRTLRKPIFNFLFPFPTEQKTPYLPPAYVATIAIYTSGGGA
jgi:hypothetical protein